MSLIQVLGNNYESCGELVSVVGRRWSSRGLVGDPWRAAK